MAIDINRTSNVLHLTKTITDLDKSVDTENISQSAAILIADADQDGAMLFIVVTICVYSLGIVAFIASHLYKKRETKIQDMQISDYLRSVNSLSLARIERMDTIRQVQFKIPKEYRSMIEYKCFSGVYWTKSDHVYGDDKESSRKFLQNKEASRPIKEV